MAEPVVPKLDSAELLALLRHMSMPGNSDQDSERMLLTFCLNCVDPHGAMTVVLEAPRGATDEAIANEAAALPARQIESIPFSELPRDHPLRSWRIG